MSTVRFSLYQTSSRVHLFFYFKHNFYINLMLCALMLIYVGQVFKVVLPQIIHSEYLSYHKKVYYVYVMYYNILSKTFEYLNHLTDISKWFLVKVCL